MRNEDLSYRLWKNVDGRRECLNYTLMDICNRTDIKIDRIKSWRSRMVVPQADELYQIANVLGCSMEYLLTGQNAHTHADEVYEYMQEKMPSLLEDIERQIRLKKEVGLLSAQ